MKTLIVFTERFHTAPLVRVGGKAKGLGWLQNAGLRVPPGFCVTTEAFDAFTASSSVTNVLSTLRKAESLTTDAVREAAKNLNSAMQQSPMPQRVSASIDDALEALIAGSAGEGDLGDTFVVRSSSVVEDLASTRAPGLFATLLGVTASGAMEAVKRVWISAFSEAAMLYHLDRRINFCENPMAVIIQREVLCDKGGVVYTLNAGSNDVSSVMIEVVDGHPSRLLNGSTPPSSYIISKTTGSVTAENVSSDSSLPTDMLHSISASACAVERLWNRPLDIEWALTNRRALVFFQARPLRYDRKRKGREFVMEARRYKAGKSGKIAAHLLAKYGGAKTVPADVITHAAFDEFKRNGARLGGTLRRILKQLYYDYTARGPTSVRSAYWSALQRADMLPQSSRILTMTQGLRFTEEYWKYVLNNRLDDYSADVTCLLTNWIEVTSSAVVSAVGIGDEVRVVIAALYGFLEGFETQVHDVYEVHVNADVYRLVRSDVPKKSSAVLTPGSSAESLPGALADAQVLNADEIQLLARIAARLCQRVGSVRLEVLVTPSAEGGNVESRLVLWQVDQIGAHDDLAYYEICASSAVSDGEVVYSGRAVHVRNLAQAEGLRRFAESNTVALLDMAQLERRDAAVASEIAVALRKSNIVVALKGSAMSHFAALLRDYGVKVFAVNTSFGQLGDGDVVCVVKPRKQHRQSLQ